MTRADKVRYLEGYYWTLANIEIIKDKIKNKNDRLYNVKSPKLSDMPRGGSTIDTVDIIFDKTELEDSLSKRLRQAEEKRQEIEDTINNINNPRYIMLLQLRYIDNLSLDDVADQMKLSYSRITKLHGLALDEVVIPVHNKSIREYELD